MEWSNKATQHGSARYAARRDLKRAQMLMGSHSGDALLLAWMGDQAVVHRRPGPLASFCGSRGGKGTGQIIPNLLKGVYGGNILLVDPKLEGAYVAQDQIGRGFARRMVTWNPGGLLGLARHRINPLSHLTRESETLISDARAFVDDFMASSTAASAAYFEGRARDAVLALVLVFVHVTGGITLPDLYRLVNLMLQGGEAWLDWAFEMSEHPDEFVQRTEIEISRGREDNAGGWPGIAGEISRQMNVLADRQLLDSVSPPFDFDFSELNDPNTRTFVCLGPPAQYIESWAPVLKAMFNCAFAHKTKTVGGPRQLWLIDEAPQLKNFGVLLRAYSLGAGLGIVPWGFWQSLAQADAHGRDGGKIILASSQVRCLYGIRDADTARLASAMAGLATLEVGDEAGAARAQHARQQALLGLLDGKDPLAVAADLKLHRTLMHHRTTMQRPLLTPDEALNLGDDMLIFADGLGGVLKARRRNYFEHPAFAGCGYHPNPYVTDNLKRVRVMTRSGARMRRVVQIPCPPSLRDWPQFRADGIRSVVR